MKQQSRDMTNVGIRMTPLSDAGMTNMELCLRGMDKAVV